MRDIINKLPAKDGYLTLNVIDLSNGTNDNIFDPTEYQEMRIEFTNQINQYLISSDIPSYIDDALSIIFKVFLFSFFYI